MGNCVSRRHSNRPKSQNIEINADAKSTYSDVAIIEFKSNDDTLSTIDDLPDDITLKCQPSNDSKVFLPEPVHTVELADETNDTDCYRLLPLRPLYLHDDCDLYDCQINDSRKTLSGESRPVEIHLKNLQIGNLQLRKPKMGELESEKSQPEEPQLEKPYLLSICNIKQEKPILQEMTFCENHIKERLQSSSFTSQKKFNWMIRTQENPLYRNKSIWNNDKIPPRFNPMSTTQFLSEAFALEEPIRQSTESSVDSGIATRETSFAADTVRVCDSSGHLSHYSEIATRETNLNRNARCFSNIDDNKDINNINVSKCQQSQTTLQEKGYKPNEETEDYENNHFIDSMTNVSDSSELSSTINSESSVLCETNETFPEDIIQTFNHSGGRMYCCDSCADYLDIPAGAIAVEERYEIIQQFPFISCQDETKCNYRVLCIKEFRERKNRAFERHVRIVNHFTSDLDVQHVKVRYSTVKGNYEEAYFKPDNSEDNFAHDVYFTAKNSVLTIFTLHFTVFIVEESIQSSPKTVFSKNPKQRYVDLVAFAYFSFKVEEKKVLLHIYIQDIQNKKYKEIKRDTDCSEVKRGNRCYFEETKLTGLPDSIKRSTEFQSLLFLSRSKWKRMLSTETFELEEMLDDEANFLKIERLSTLGKVSYNQIPAGDILNSKTNVQPLLGDFKLKYEETETIFAPIIIIKTSTPVSPSQENCAMQQPQIMQVSRSQVNVDEVNLIQSANLDEIRRPKLLKTDMNSRRKKGFGCWKYSEANEGEDISEPQAESSHYKECAASKTEIFTESKFHGLLSDKGLFQLVDHIGAEWNELACMLDVPPGVQDQLKLDSPCNTRLQIINMLRWWRGRLSCDESIAKDRLCEALLSIGKSDIAVHLMKELVEGNTEDIPNTDF